MYLPGCPPRPDMLMDAFNKLHEKIRATKFAVHRDDEITEREDAGMAATPTLAMKGLLR
jgi:NADH-quinone oxidoreductase subunit B